MPSKQFILAILIASLVLIGCIATGLPNSQPTSTSGHEISFQEIKLQDKSFMIVKINPEYFNFHIISNTAKPNSESINEVREDNSADLAFNGSFYDEDFRPLGLLISDSRSIFPLNKSQLMNGVFTLNRDDNPVLYSYDDFEKQQTTLLPTIDFAIQSGPILLDEQGQITVDQSNTKKSGRTALAIDKDGNVVLIMLRESLFNQANALTLYNFAEIISTSNELSDLGLHSMINLDGGKSSGLALKDQYYPEIEKVQNIITVSKRS